MGQMNVYMREKDKMRILAKANKLQISASSLLVKAALEYGKYQVEVKENDKA